MGKSKLAQWLQANLVFGLATGELPRSTTESQICLQTLMKVSVASEIIN